MTPFRHAALSGAVAAACLAMAAQVVAQPASQQPMPPDAHCGTDARGRFNDRCTADRRAVEVHGVDRLPETSERELPKLTFILGDERTLQERRHEDSVQLPGAAEDRSDTHTPRFDSGADLLKPEDRRRLDDIVAKVKGRPQLRFEIVGHTDVQRISRSLRARFPDNQALGLARAHQVGRYLTQQLGLPETAYQAASKGPDQPRAEPREAPANWAANRRVEVSVYWQEEAAPRAMSSVRLERSDPTECNMLTPYAEGDGPLRITIDGDPQLGKDSSSADRQRCIDVRLERHRLRLQYDSLAQSRRLNAAAWPTTVAAGDTVRFAGYSNYLLFLKKAELRVYTANDVRQARLLATVPLDRELRGQWQVPPGLAERFADAAGGKLYYRLRVYDATGNFDETGDFTLTLGDRPTAADVQARADKELMAAYGDSRLAITNIAVRGGTVTASGEAIRADQKVRALGHAVPVDAHGRFVFQQIVPRRVHTGEIAVLDADGSQRVYRRDFEVPQEDWFFVGQADLTVGHHRVRGPAEAVRQDERYGSKHWEEGRLAFYAKGQLNERWTLTASVDTEERALDELWKNLDRKDAASLFRRMDPADSWSTFGDDSTTIEDAPTQGRVYLKVDDGRSHALWGNFKLALNETELAQVSRGLYGLHGRYAGTESTEAGDARLRIDAYAAEPGTLSAREELRGTGGSLYYLRNQDLTRGAERVHVEVRDRDSGLVLLRRQLVPASDYEVDYLQGRVLLSAPLPSLSDDGSIVRAGGLTGQPTFLVVDYEYAPLLSSLDTLAVGGRVSWWATDALRVGMTASRQQQVGGDQRLGGVDLMLRKTETTYLKAEVARSEGPGTTQLTSLDGGYHFSGAPLDRDTDASAFRVEGQADLRDFGLTKAGRAGAYVQVREAGFSAPGQLAANETRQAGVSGSLALNDRTELKLKADRRDEEQGYDSDAAEAQLGVQLTPNWKLWGHLRHDRKDTDAVVTSPSLPATQAVEGERTDVGLQLDFDSLRDWSVYGFLQGTARRTGTRRDNDRGGLGGRYRVNDKLALHGELSGGDGGLAGKAGVDYQYDDRSSVYLTYVQDTGRTDENTLGRGGTMVTGLKSRVGEGWSAYTEHRHSTGAQPGLTHAYGVQYAPDTRWTVGVHLETGRVGRETLGELERQAVALSAGYATEQVRYSGGVEYRDDRGTADHRQSWLLKNALSYKVGDDARWLAKLNWADSDSSQGALAAARYTEAVLGYAFRPVLNDKLNLLFKYTYLYDLSSPGQVSVTGVTSQAVSSTGIDYQQRSHVWAADVNYDLSPRWTIGGRYAWRRGELKPSRDDAAPWFESTATLAVLRVDWKVVRQWDWLVELRSLRAEELKDRRTGWLTAGYYHLNENFKVGIGYNFTNFSDELTDLDYRSRGWFLNMLGKF
ncbi:OmpA family protein [Eleftheria terrae]|uniref:OmpA family protein n=1 Tax=Eleftheria terrae TaxID=1597781 RepID=UPI00263BC394|nr:OmpA family protein [Eleftheria terrae]WKB56152.1 OmpA family protein [Eleftheria terrae]